MPRKRAILIVIFVLAALLCVGAVLIAQQRLVADREERERNIIAIHFLATEAKHDGETATDIDGLLKHFGGKDSVLMRPFPDGLVYKWDGESFTLEEPRPRRISLFKKDRLIATNRKWPRWESSGEYARKFPEQEVPEWGDE
jgi:hypothetical protein